MIVNIFLKDVLLLSKVGNGVFFYFFSMFFRKILIITLLSPVMYLNSAVHETIHETNSHFLNLPNEIVQALSNGDAKAISNFFNTSVELNINESQAVYGKAQAEQILRYFFNNNAFTNGKFNFKQLHKGDRDNVQFYIGELHGKGSYRVTIYMKDQRIHQMKIESND